MLGMACNEDAMKYLRTPADNFTSAQRLLAEHATWRRVERTVRMSVDFMIFGVHVVERSTVYKGFHCAKERTSFSLSHVITNTDAATLNAQAAFLSLNVSTLLMSF